VGFSVYQHILLCLEHPLGLDTHLVQVRSDVRELHTSPFNIWSRPTYYVFLDENLVGWSLR